MNLVNTIKSWFAWWNTKSFFPIFSLSWNDDKPELVGQYKRWVYTAISTIATDIASLEYGVFKNNKKVDHKYLDLINYDLLEAISTHLLLLWISVLWKVRLGNNIVQLVILRPDKIYKNEDGEYIYNLWWKTYKFVKDDLIIFKNFNPENPESELSWYSPVEAGIYSILLDDFSTKWNYKFFKQWGKIWLVLETDRNIPPETRKALKIQFQEASQGLDNAHKPIVLEWGLKIQNISTSAKDMDFTEMKATVRDEILSYFKVPKAIVWLGEWNNLNIRNFEKIYAKRTLLPIAKKIEAGLNKFLFTEWFRFLKVVPVDDENLIKHWNNGVITLNEYRQKLNYDLLKDGDVLKVWTDLVPVKFEKTIKETTNNELVSKAMKLMKKEIVGSEEWADKKRKGFTKRADSFEEIFAKKMKVIFNKQRKNIEAELRTWKSLNKYKKKDLSIFFVDKFKNWLVWLWLLQKPVKNFFTQEYKQSIEELGKAPKDFFTAEKDEELNKATRTYILKLADQIDKTTLDEISKIVSEGLNNSLWVDVITNQIDEKFDEYLWKRVEKIVRTETTRISNRWNQTAREDVGITKKKWFTAEDERTCPYCNQFNGKVVEVKENFVKGWDVLNWIWKSKLILDTDIQYPPLHPNCRCIIVPEID